jgi:N-methylhydantoinase A/oxoprolinase/acetone carboxylase beta subunit
LTAADGAGARSLDGAKAREYIVGVDIGGTFTDLVALDPSTGEVLLAKTPTVPGALEDGLANGLRELRSFGDVVLGEVRHGTTAVTNALLERRFVRTALLCTAGFRDVLERRRLWREHLFGHDWERPKTLIPRHLRLEVSERMGSRGEVVRPLDEAEVRAIAAELRDQQVESVAVSYLFSFLNAEHEQRTAAILAEELPGVPVSLSSEIMPEIHEYERTSTTAINALVAPIVERYLGRVDQALQAEEVRGPLRMVRSDGLLMSPEVASREPVRLVMSGPAAGVQGAVRLGRRLGWDNIITLDMGGTSTDVSLIWRGEALRSAETDIEWNIPVSSTQIDIASIGAGGGSIAAVAAGGELTVGPESAGAAPGPACYRRGGLDPTVTDALAALGVFPENLLGGDFALDVGAAHDVLRSGVPIYDDTVVAADAIVYVTLHKMALLIREATINRGYDPRECTLFCFGGAGGAFAADVARELGIGTAYIPPAASVFSALGAALSQVGYEAVKSLFTRLERLDLAQLEDAVADVEARAGEALVRDALPVSSVRTQVNLKYRSQPQAVSVTLEGDGPIGERLDAAIHRFHDEHHRLYAMRRDEEPIDLVSVSSTAMGPDSSDWPLAALRRKADAAAVEHPRRTWRRRGEVLTDVPVVDLAALRDGETAVHEGPCFIQDAFTTIAVPPDVTARVDPLGGVSLEV